MVKRNTEILEYAELYIRSAIEQFQIDYQHLDTERDIYFKYKISQDANLVASCQLELDDNAEALIITISENCLFNLTKGIRVESEDENPIFEWRIYWLVFHEIGHWLYGHIPYYEKNNWLTNLGISESSESPRLYAEIAPSQQVFDQPLPLAHAAELQADSFATIELFKLLRRIPVDDGDEYENELELDIQFCYYSIITVICLFYANKRADDLNIFHPSWNLRCLNMIVTLFRAYSHAAGLDLGNAIYSDDAIKRVSKNFMTEAILVTVEGIEDFALEIGMNIRVHDDELSGLYDPWVFLKVLTGEVEGSLLTQELFTAFKNAELLSSETSALRSAKNFSTQSLQTHDLSKKDNEFTFHIASGLSDAKTRTVLKSWAIKHELELGSAEIEPHVNYPDGMLSVKVSFGCENEITEATARGFVSLLLKKIANEDGFETSK